jgi:hypothetical protein
LIHDIHHNTLQNPLPWVVHITEVPENSAMMLQNLKRHSSSENSHAYNKIYAIATTESWEVASFPWWYKV